MTMVFGRFLSLFESVVLPAAILPQIKYRVGEGEVIILNILAAVNKLVGLVFLFIKLFDEVANFIQWQPFYIWHLALIFGVADDEQHIGFFVFGAAAQLVKKTHRAWGVS